jgi:hypothetical protein
MPQLSLPGRVRAPIEWDISEPFEFALQKDVIDR